MAGGKVAFHFSKSNTYLLGNHVNQHTRDMTTLELLQASELQIPSSKTQKKSFVEPIVQLNLFHINYWMLTHNSDHDFDF